MNKPDLKSSNQIQKVKDWTFNKKNTSGSVEYYVSNRQTMRRHEKVLPSLALFDVNLEIMQAK